MRNRSFPRSRPDNVWNLYQICKVSSTVTLKDVVRKTVGHKKHEIEHETFISKQPYIFSRKWSFIQ
jgi:hypothetical protein